MTAKFLALWTTSILKVKISSILSHFFLLNWIDRYYVYVQYFFLKKYYYLKQQEGWGFLSPSCLARYFPIERCEFWWLVSMLLVNCLLIQAKDWRNRENNPYTRGVLIKVHSQPLNYNECILFVVVS